MQHKPQKRTLSIRVSDDLREFLERLKWVLSTPGGPYLSTSDVPNMLLESAKHDSPGRLFEIADLRQQRRSWTGIHFRAGIIDGAPERSHRYYFCRYEDGVVLDSRRTSAERCTPRWPLLYPNCSHGWRSFRSFTESCRCRR